MTNISSAIQLGIKQTVQRADLLFSAAWEFVQKGLNPAQQAH